MAVVIKGVVTQAPDTSNPEATLNVLVKGGEGEGEQGGFISVQLPSSELSGIVAGACSLTFTQP